MDTLSRAERAALARTALETGPDAPTLCGGWDVSDLVVHLLVREREPIAATGIALPPMAWLTERRSKALAAQDFAERVERFAGGPPPWSPFALPLLDRLGNALELFIHHEDIRRAAPDWEPRTLPAEHQAVLWKQLGLAGRAAVRPAKVPVEAVWGERRTTLAPGADPVVLRGEPSEIVLLVSGRAEHRVELGGPPDAVRRLRDALGG